ncbi:MAG: branched-chain amino acid ABC transporter ATP-binding protein/permease [Pseudonocardiaceae bacterium]|uniref:branched-chain amino acid ABC transporter ATP-binding protein/permease n=1 Tax=Afipia sp. 1NLS2 TaxID=666684 RepID=UPI0001DA0D69|nr:branched-chain amino acid ABC transporter ATP-binding protein/permease [Afipia sp. 1NLS2]EFI52704.1 ABC transporter related protein [Afipia sp. 1NLS2]RTL65002.1 MAG: branched-chain amino acid ABC transporter ATP-binding protein/permease [Pseudonocardiaceae bacterium]
MNQRLLTPLAFIALAIFLVALPFTAENEYSLRLFMLFTIYAIVALGLNVLVGLAGLISLGQAGLFALGAYTGAILATRLGLDFVLAAVAGTVVAGAFGALLAYPTVRVRGVYLAVITIAFGLIVENVIIEWHHLTGGTTGISSIPKPTLFGWPLGGFRYYSVLAVLLFLVVLVTHNIKQSRYGRAMLAVSQSETAARGTGLNVVSVRTLAFVIAAATAGLGGVLYAFLNLYISPDSFTFNDSIRFLLMVVLGGAGSTVGALLGALVLTYLPEYLQQLQYWQQFAYGLLLALVMFVLPHGIFGTLSNLFTRFFGRATTRPPMPVGGIEKVLMDAKAGQAPASFSAEGLTIRFGGLTALNKASMHVAAGEIHALIGPNGAGKSTMVNIVTGFYRPNEGRVTLDGINLAGSPPHLVARNGVARTFQNTELFGDLTVIENVMVGYQKRLSYGLFEAALRVGRFHKEEAECRHVAEALLAFVGLTNFTNEKARFLAFGLQRRLEIARALASAPRLLLLDEPAAGLTTQEIDELDRMIRRMASLGISVLLIEHHVDLIMSVADRVTVLDYGVVIASDKPAIIQSDPRVIEAYFGVAPATHATEA